MDDSNEPNFKSMSSKKSDLDVKVTDCINEEDEDVKNVDNNQKDESISQPKTDVNRFYFDCSFCKFLFFSGESSICRRGIKKAETTQGVKGIESSCNKCLSYLSFL